MKILNNNGPKTEGNNHGIFLQARISLVGWVDLGAGQILSALKYLRTEGTVFALHCK